MGQFATKTVAHGVSGGLQNMIQGGDFGSGMLSGSVGHATGFVGGSIGGDVSGVVGSGLGGGITSALSGGDFGRGFQMGSMQYGFNYLGEGIVGAGVGFAKQIYQQVDSVLNITGMTASAVQSAAGASGVVKVEAKAQTVGRIVAAGQIGKSANDYRQGKISKSEMYYRLGSYSSDLVIPPGWSIFKNIVFLETELH